MPWDPADVCTNNIIYCLLRDFSFHINYGSLINAIKYIKLIEFNIEEICNIYIQNLKILRGQIKIK